MGYTHYWRRPKTLEKRKYKAFCEDLKKILAYCEDELGIDLANGLGVKRPVIEEDKVSFNGSDAQRLGVWTTTEDVVIPWPSATAGLTEPIADPIAKKTDGTWFAGHVLQQRVAPIGENGLGSGSYESVYIPRVIDEEDYFVSKDEGLYFEFCKTAYRPYDIGVTACLIALKHHFPKCIISSDGEEKDWLDGRMVCFNLFGYGFEESLRD